MVRPIIEILNGTRLAKPDREETTDNNTNLDSDKEVDDISKKKKVRLDL